MSSLANALPSILDGLVSILAGHQPPSSVDLGSLYLVIDGIVLLLVAGALWSLVRLLRRGTAPRQHQSLLRVRLVEAAEIVFPLVLLLSLPVLAGIPWTVFLLYLPDLSLSLFVLSGLVIGAGTLRIGRTFLQGFAQ